MTDKRTEQFVERLERLEPADRARLRRSAGLPLAEATDSLGLFFRLLPPNLPDWLVDRYFLVATLFPLADGGGQGDLGATLRRARTNTNERGLNRRVEALLDSDLDQLRFRLRQAARFAHSSRVRVNWAKLLDDLGYWDHPDRWVQRRWAQSYFAGPATTTKPEKGDQPA